ncbi:MAG: tRNA pseudouridine(38-40) synthase TruA [Caldilineaceae bacterium]
MAPDPVCSVCALIAYDGTDFHGFQYQVGVPTIQGALEDALLAFTKASVRVVGSGRTDAGVHARGQVIAAQVPWRHSVANLQRAWNAHLPPSVVILRASQAPAQFHPRFSARSRTYRYTVCAQNVANGGYDVKRMPLAMRFAHYEKQPLNVGLMQQAANYLLGKHDFLTFGQPPQGDSTIRTVLRAQWQEVITDLLPVVGQPSLSKMVFTVTANAFLRNMVRNLVGSLLKVGRGEWAPEEILSALQACDRSRSAPPAPPSGLVLEAVEYPQYPELLLFQ